MFLLLQTCRSADFCTDALLKITEYQEINFQVKNHSHSAPTAGLLLGAVAVPPFCFTLLTSLFFCLDDHYLNCFLILFESHYVQTSYANLEKFQKEKKSCIQPGIKPMISRLQCRALAHPATATPLQQSV